MSSDQHTAPVASRTLRIAGFVALATAAAVAVAGIASRASNQEKIKQWTLEQSVPTVSVIQPGTSGEVSAIVLPARFEAFSRAPIYARVNGYLKHWYADIGSQVRAGQLLAEIETPDIQQQLLQARADLATAQANLELASTTAERWKSLLDSGAVSPQEVDEKVGDLAAKRAMLKSAQANVERLTTMQGFARIVAPFSGTVTARDTDTGALINAGSSNGPALFEIADTHKLRLYVNVPQSYASSIKPTTQADISVPEHPGRTYTATVETSARAVDAASGAMLVQLLVDNRTGELLPGGFANVSLKLPGSVKSLSIPSSALVFDQSGVHVATVGNGDKAVMKTVTIARDLGKTVELSAGLEATDRVIENPPDGIGNGDSVRVMAAAPQKAVKKS